MKKLLITLAVVCLISTPAFAGFGDNNSHHNGNITTTHDSHNTSSNYDTNYGGYESHYSHDINHDYSMEDSPHSNSGGMNAADDINIDVEKDVHVEAPETVYHAPQGTDIEISYHGSARESGQEISFDKFDLEMSKKLAVSGSIDTFTTDKEVYVEAYFKGNRGHISASRCLAAARVAAWKAGGNFDTMTIEIRVTPVAYNSSFKLGGGSTAGMGTGGGSMLAPSLMGGIGTAKSLYTYDIEITILADKSPEAPKSMTYGGGQH